MTIQLKVGYRYKTRCGVLVDIVSVLHSVDLCLGEYPEYSGTSTGKLWRHNGNFSSDYFEESHILTITEELGPTPEG
jgi:hypothetical protein